MSFRLKTIIGVALIEAVLLFLLIWSGLEYIESSNQREFAQRAQATVKSFAVTTKDAVLSTDLASLESFVAEVMRYPGVRYARVRDADGLVLAQAGDSEALARPFSADQAARTVSDGIFDTFAAIDVAGVGFGQVEVGLSVEALQSVIADARKYGTLIAIIEMVLVGLFSFVLGVYLTRQLGNLTEASGRIADGELGCQVPVRGSDELARTAQAFNLMSARVEESYHQLADQERNLRTVLETIQDGILVTSLDGRVRSLNPAAGATFGYPEQQASELSLSDLIDHEDWSSIAQQLQAGDRAVWGELREVKGRHRDAHEFPMELTLTHTEQGDSEVIVAVVRNISERKSVEEQLRLRERVITASSVGVVMVEADKPDRPIIYVNPAFERITGYSAAEVIGRNCRFLQGADTDPGALAELRTALDTQRECRVLLRNYRKDGNGFWNELSITPIFDETERLTHFVGLQHDVTERINGELQLAESEAHLRGVLDATHDAIIVTDDHGVIQSFNRGAEHMFGYSGDAMLGRNVSHLVPSPHRERHDDYMRQYRERSTSNVVGNEREFDAQRVDGENFPIALRVSEMGKGGQRFFIGVIHDITERKQKEQALQQAKVAAEQAAAAKSQFLANMSHEIRTPMHGVLAALEMLRDTPMNRSQQRYLETANTSAEVLLTVIDEILDFSRLEAGKLRIERLDFDPRKAVEDVTTMLSQRAFDKGLEIVSFIDPAVPAGLKGDPIRLRQVLINLVGNALKFTDHGEVVVSVVVRVAKADAVELRFEVKDTGIGIAPEKQVSLFDSFIQADGSTSRRFGGTGLGLTISRRLVELMGGEIDIESREGAGSTFWFDLPFGRKTDSSLKQELDFSGRRVLVVDDNATNRIIMHRYLSGWGGSPGSAADGEEALAKMQDSAASGQPYDLAILDFHMPGMNGAELSRLIRQDESLQQTRLIMVSSESYSEQLEAELDVDIWLTKPLRQSDLHDAIATVLGKLDRAPDSMTPGYHKGLNFNGEQVLLVEDNPVSQSLAREMLRRRGLNVQTASNGLEAAELATRGGFAVILMDVQMPEMDGYEATQRILDWEDNQGVEHTPIIALTAHALPQDRQRCLNAGMDDYLVKPYNQEALSNIIFRWLKPPQNGSQDDGVSVFNTGKLKEIKTMMGDHFGELLTQFRDALGEQLELVDGAAQTSDVEMMQNAVHRIKNNAGDLGAAALYDIAADLERLFEGNRIDIDQVNQLLDAGRDVLAATTELLNEETQ